MALHYHHFKERGCFRAWLSTRNHGRNLLKAEVSWRTKLCLFDLGFDEDSGTIGLTWAIPYLFVHVGFFWPRKWMARGEFYGDIEIIRLSISGGSFGWSFWHDSMGWSSKTPKWRHGSFNPIDFLLGHREYSDEIIEEREIEISMPEATYRGTAQLKNAYWKRPRWPWRLKVVRAEIETPDGVPFPGKGTSSWNCGQDATYSMTCPADSIEQGIEAFKASVERDRLRYGGPRWKPEEAA